MAASRSIPEHSPGAAASRSIPEHPWDTAASRSIPWVQQHPEASQSIPGAQQHPGASLGISSIPEHPRSAAASRSIPRPQQHPGASPGLSSIPEHPPGSSAGQGWRGRGRPGGTLARGHSRMGFPRAAENLRPFGRRGLGLCAFPRARLAPQDPGTAGTPQARLLPCPRVCIEELAGQPAGTMPPTPCDAAREAAEQSPRAGPMPSEQSGGSFGIISTSLGRCMADTPSSFPHCPALSCLVAPHPKPAPRNSRACEQAHGQAQPHARGSAAAAGT